MNQLKNSPAPPRKVVKAIGPKLRKLLYVVLFLLALLIANSGYLAVITSLEWFTEETYQNFFYQCMFLGHLALGLLLVVPFMVFALIHMANTRYRRNRRAVKVGYALFLASVVLLVTGLLLFRIGGLELRHPTGRSIAYWMHVISPLIAIWLYVVHRLAGPKIRWKYGAAYVGAVAVTVGLMATMHSQDPRKWNVVGPEEGESYFRPSLARTSSGNFINAKTMMMDDYCKACHADVHKAWEQSSHRLSSFNNPVYLASVRETRKVSLERDGTVKAARWCAGCHDPVPFFSGAFDDPNYDDIGHLTSQAGITCTSCHAITNVNSNRGNADYTIEEPIHYPFAFSDNAALQWLNHQLVKAKPEFHKKTFLKPHHKTAEFCSSCHKVNLTGEVTGYKEFLRGQNHYDPWLLSGVSGHGAKSFYYPEVAQSDCNGCHMPAKVSSDFGAKPLDESGQLKVHDHLFPGANTGLAWLKDCPDALAAHTELLEASTRVDLFAIREGGAIDGKLHAPLGPKYPELEPGKSYLVDAVIRTLKLGHMFTQGTVDSNEVWVEVTATSGGREIGRSGKIDETGEVDRWAHFVNVFMLDQEGNRINRRNAQDIRTPLYDHQIPPGAGNVVHYSLQVPEDLTDHVTIEVSLKYRKFDQEFMQIVADSLGPDDHPLRGHERGKPYKNPLPIVTMATDKIVLPVRGVNATLPKAETRPIEAVPVWQRWNDYGIGLLLKGKAVLKQAEEAFKEVEGLGRFDGPLNLARVYQIEGRLDEATAALARADKHTDPAPPSWTLGWLAGAINAQQGHLDVAIENFRAVLNTKVPERKFDFSRDYTVRNELGQVLYQRAQQVRSESMRVERDAVLREAVAEYQQVLAIDSENSTAHYGLELCYRQLGEDDKAELHAAEHMKFKRDDTIAGEVIGKARKRYPAADFAAEAVVIYPLDREPQPASSE
jgi:tetratricopeptide (TPR) repeat protein